MDKQALYTINKLAEGMDINTIGNVLAEIDNIPGAEIAEDGHLQITDWDAWMSQFNQD